MIRDYKFDPAINDSRRKKGLGRFLFPTLVLLACAAAVWQFVDFGNLPTKQQESTLQLEAPPTREEPEEPQRVSQPLQLPLTRSQDESSQETGAASDPVENSPAVPATLLPKSAPTAPDTRQGEALATPTSDASTVDGPKRQAEMGPQWLTHKIERGESLASIFKLKSLSPGLLHRIVNSSKQAKQLAKIRPGQELRFLLNDEDGLEELVLIKSAVESVRIRATEEGFDTDVVSKDVEKRIASTTGTIESSLFVDGQKAGLSDSQIMELAALFGWDIDFALEIRSGDQFRLVFEEQFLDGEKFRNGPILAAEFVNKGNVYQAFRFEDQNGDVGYYDADGRNKRRAFIRTPIKFARVSSRFTNKRWHPVLKKWRSHKGVDYAAPTGTPIKATGAGKVIFRGWKGGYGRVVIVQHGSKYRTLYAHMSKFSSKAKAGKKVKQGQIIGYVGKSGLATGPHLHYEFRVNGVHRNPLTVKLPKSLPLPKSQLARFKKQTAPLVAKLASIAQSTMVAISEH